MSKIPLNPFSDRKKPILIDVTLRDGGYLNDWNFNERQIQTAISAAGNLGADIIEIGYLDNEPGLPVTASWPPDFFDTIMHLKNGFLFAAMVRPSVKDAKNVLRSRKDTIDLVRIPVDLRNTDPANRLSELCSESGMCFTFNLTSVSCYTDSQIGDAVRSLNPEAAAVYIADSRGALLPDDVRRIVSIVKNNRAGLTGYHAHNNLGLAYQNTKEALLSGCKLIDGSLCGIGLGGRNLNLSEAIDLAKEYRTDWLQRDGTIPISEEMLGVPKVSDESIIYHLSGERNIKMEWIQLMIDQLGVETTKLIVDRIPRSNYYYEEELKPYIEKKYWDRIQW
ncbi:MAG: hypothetical protein EA359_07100 [Balneolaceae bacterium]|nr:MAG: hypothetical protein EA359_07100 [Balneolaceae bacterium]